MVCRLNETLPLPACITGETDRIEIRLFKAHVSLRTAERYSGAILMTYLWLATWLLLTFQVLMVTVFVILLGLFTRNKLDATAGPIPPLPSFTNKTT